MIKGFAKCNGLVMACCYIFYAVFYCLDEGYETIIKESFIGKLLKPIVRPKEIDPTMYFVLLVASLVLIGGIYLERKRLLLPFVITFLWVLGEETEYTFKVGLYRKALFIVYVALSLVLLLVVQNPFSSCEKSKLDDKTGQKKLQTVVVKK